MKINSKKVISMTLSIIVMFFISHKYLEYGNSVLSIVLIFPIYYFLNNVIGAENKRKFTISIVIAILFSAMETIGNTINTDYTLNHLLDEWNVINFVGYTIIFWATISYLYGFLENINKNQIKSKFLKIKNIEILSTSKKSFFINVGLMILAWLPYFLKYCPGILTSDSIKQIEQIVGTAELSNHHPILHTGIISVFINAGTNIFDDINVGVALYTVFQMLAMAIMFAFVLKYMCKKNVPTIIRGITLLYYMFYPVHAIYSVTMWKDILFSGMIPIYVIFIMELLSDTDNYVKDYKKLVMFTIISLLVMFLRNNGVYIVLLTLPFIIIVSKKHWKKLITISGIIVVSFFSIKTVIFNVLDVKDGSVREMLSIPLQQIARVQKYHTNELDEATNKTINSYFKYDGNIGDKYCPTLSDPVKDLLDDEYFEQNKTEFIKLWGELLIPYFKDYVESFISNSYGYYYPEAVNWITCKDMEENRYGIKFSQLIDGKLISKISSLTDRRDIPMVSMCLSVGMAFWLILLSLGYEIYMNRYKNIVIYIPILVLWLTLIASPVFCEYRYAYSMFTILPLYIGTNLIEKARLKDE